MLPLGAALPALLAGPEAVLPVWQRPPAPLVVWSRAARLGLRLVRTHRIAPTLVRGPDGGVRAAWTALADGHPESRALADRCAVALPPAGHALVADGSVPSAEALIASFLDAVADWCARRGTPEPSGRRPRARLLPWTARWVEGLTDSVDPTVPLREEADELLAGVRAWLDGASGAQAERAELTLRPPDDSAAGERAWRLDFAVRTPDGTAVAARHVWAGADGHDVDPVRLQQALLRGLGRAARVFAPLDEALSGTAPEGLDIDRRQAWTFVSEAAPALEGTDVVVVLPDGIDEPALSVRVRIDDDRDAAGATEAEIDGGVLAALDAEDDAALSFEVTLDGEPLTPDELERVLDTDVPLVAWRGRWLRVDPGVREQLAALSDGGRVGLLDGVLLGLAGSAPLSALAPDAEWETPVEVVAGGRVGDLVATLRAAAERPEVPASPDGFAGVLRSYQRRGVAWLSGMASLGLGAVLADAMGLGKTPQLIAHLLGRGTQGPHLVVCPTSVVGNWERELARFAPDLPVTRFHGPERPDTLQGVHGVVVTSYGLLRRAADPLADVAWDVVALDEAQHVKNPQTAGARAARRLSAEQTVVLTGTPMENRLTELWTMLDLTNRGLFGSRARFGREFVTPVERRGDRAAATRLRRIVAPFVLRREKDDPEVAVDLPDKIERTVACVLTPEQARLYETEVDKVLGGSGLADASAMERRGRVLALLTALKQICNHPAQYLKEGGSPVLPGRSGKLAAAREIVGEAVDAGERVLVFTQFVQMGRLLAAQLGTDLGAELPFLHGGLAAGARDRMVAAFQGDDGDAPPVLVISLRAGGTGLNLTAATQVVHYDRWWNPAVEDQATDRVHRIGQHRGVEVHKLVTAGTVEERIDGLLERKRELTASVVGAGEAWITELDDDGLHDLVALSAEGESLEDDTSPLVEGYAYEEAS